MTEFEIRRLDHLYGEHKATVRAIAEVRREMDEADDPDDFEYQLCDLLAERDALEHQMDLIEDRWLLNPQPAE